MGMKIKFALLMVVAAFYSAQGKAQEQTVSIQTLYTNQAFYSLENGEVANINNQDWDIAFSCAGQGAAGSAILINEGSSEIYASPFDTSGWMTFDTTNFAMSWERQLNSDTSWTNGALNTYRGAAGFLDLGWGILDPANNFWTLGDSLYTVVATDGSYKKLWIESLATGVWNFKYADLNGENETSVSFAKTDYPDRNFIYYSMVSDELIDREPANDSWELTFQKHQDELMPGLIMPVTSVFTNKNIWTAKSNEVDFDAAMEATEPQTQFTQNAINIGREWKYYNSDDGWLVYDSIAYFAWDIDSTDFYRIVFTGFGGMADGNFHFNQTNLNTINIEEEDGNNLSFSIYPNPTTDYVSILLQNDQAQNLNIELRALNGALVINEEWNTNFGVQQKRINLSDLSSGLYVLTIGNENFRESMRLIKE